MSEEWESPDLRDIHSDLSKLRSYQLGDSRWMDLMRAAMDLVKAADRQLLASPPAKPAPADGWQPIETAPYDTRVLLKVGSMTFPAKLHQGVSMDEDGNDCDQWSAIFEGEHPPCWSGGACWASNEDEVPSIQPSAWKPLSTAQGEALKRESVEVIGADIDPPADGPHEQRLRDQRKASTTPEQR